MKQCLSPGNSWKSDGEEESAKEITPFLDKEENATAKEIPKYLEVILGPEHILENDGYEIPNQMMQKANDNVSSASEEKSQKDEVLST